ncbi:MAG TPA: CinA family protein [Levilinea sp.]|nr:CinA family protein [Levilinea sp.]
MDGNLAETIGKRLRKRGLKLSVAESCTGGLAGHLLTNIAGASDYFLGGAIAYANETKERLLGVRQDTLIAHGAVSRATVIEMAVGARRAVASFPELDHTIGLSISGIAGPGGATAQKPLGLVWIGLSTPNGDWAWEYHFNGNRIQVKTQAAEQALQHLADYLKDHPFQPVPVETRTQPSGELLPVSFSWQGCSYHLADWGRRWHDDTGLHVLVTTTDHQTIELVMVSDSAWLLNTASLPPSFV